MKGILRTARKAIAAAVLRALVLAFCVPTSAWAQSAQDALVLGKINWDTSELTGDAVTVRKCVNVLPFGFLVGVSVNRSGGTAASVDITILEDDVDPATTTKAVHLLKKSAITADLALLLGLPYEALKANGTKKQLCVSATANGGSSNLEIKLRATGITTRASNAATP